MKLNRSPLIWVALVALLVVVGLRFSRDIEKGKGSTVFWGVGIALVIVGALWWWQSASRKGVVQALASTRPGDFAAGVRSTTTNTALTKQVAKELGTKAKGTLNINAVSANARELTLWYGANKPTLTVQASRITSLHTGEVSEGIHRYPNVIVTIDERLPLAFSPRLEDGDTAEGFTHRLATALGLPAERINPPLPGEQA